MILFHGSKAKFERFQAPAATGNLASGEGERRRTGVGHIYVSSDVRVAQEYAVKGDGAGYIYAVDVPDETPTLAEFRAQCGAGKQKESTFQGTTYVVSPEDIVIQSMFHVKKKRGEQVQVTPIK